MGLKLKITIFVSLIVLLQSFSRGEINLQDVSEGACIKPPPKPVTFDLMWAIEFGAEAKFVPMASEVYFAYSTQALRNKPLLNFDEVNQMCFHIDTRGFSSSIQGFGTKKEFECELRDIGTLLCGDPEKMNDETLKDDQKNATLIVATWTDHKNYMVTVSCFPTGLKAWNVVSNRKTVSESSKANIFKHIKTFGFDPKKAVTQSYMPCK